MDSEIVLSKAYQYSQLTSVTSMRLLRLMGGAPNDFLQCEIDVVDTEDDLDYEAVSYVWGTSEHRPLIQISCVHGESELEIPANLRDALRRFRHPSSTRTLWVDSICINQKDDDERSQQVRLMGRIYRKASAVLIWLGEDVDEGKTEQACHCMNLLEQALPKMEEAHNNDFNGLPKRLNHYFVEIKAPSPDIVHRDLGIPFLGSPEFDALIDLLKNPWFFRAWTWQENFLAKESIFFRGSWSWSGQFMRTVCLILCNLNSAYGNNDEFLSGYCNALSMTASLDFWESRANLDFQTISAEDPKTFFKLLGLLTLRRGSDCTHPSDLVYSLLGAALETSDIEIDYKQPWEMVFAKSAWKIMIQRGNLSILPNVEKHRQSSALPTWVPDWRVKGSLKGISNDSMKNMRYAATGSSRPFGSLSDDAKVLTVYGLNWDRVYGAKNALSANIDEWVNGMFATVVDDNRYYAPTNESLVQALRRVCFTDQTQYTTAHNFTRWRPNSHEEFEEIMQGAFSNGPDGRLKYEVLVKSFIELVEFQSIVVSESGRLGIACDDVLPGDVIAMLLGGEVPVALRPLENQPGHYTFVSECYIHGFMDGESLVDARRSAQPEHDPSDVSWLHSLHASDIPFPVQEFDLH